MISQMLRLVAGFLILGWVSLSGIDVVEDLDDLPGQVQISSSSRGNASTTKRGGWGPPFANNIIESANRTHQTNVALVTDIPIIFDAAPVLDRRRHSQLHKLFHVFLI